MCMSLLYVTVHKERDRKVATKTNGFKGVGDGSEQAKRGKKNLWLLLNCQHHHSIVIDNVVIIALITE